jgi:hypothetical protein
VIKSGAKITIKTDLYDINFWQMGKKRVFLRKIGFSAQQNKKQKPYQSSEISLIMLR